MSSKPLIKWSHKYCMCNENTEFYLTSLWWRGILVDQRSADPGLWAKFGPQRRFDWPARSFPSAVLFCHCNLFTYTSGKK